MNKSFNCKKCGNRWTDSHNISPCPRCGGHGLKDPNCTCPHVRMGIIGQVKVRKSEDPNCPVHSQKVATK